MELLEYQAKELFRMVGIPILPSQTIKDSRKIKQLQIPYPVVLKSQVRSGGRGKAGGVRFVGNTIDAIAATRSIFNLSILGEYPEVILAEAHYNTERELFLAIVLDYDLQCPVLLGSAFGGMNVNSLLGNLHQVVVNTEFSLFFARRLAANMGLSGKLICSVSEIIAKMYCLFQEKDLELIEINPLGINTKGELMALDGKITINDHALARQPIVETLNFSEHQKKSTHHSIWKKNKDFSQINWRWLDWHHKTGKIATICNSFDSALLTWDLLKQKKAIPARSAILENSLTAEVNNLQLYGEQLLNILTELESYPEIKVIILNIWETEAVSREIMQTIIDYCQAAEESALPSREEPILVNSNIARREGQPNYSQSAQSNQKFDKPHFILRLLNEDNLKIQREDGVNDLSTSGKIYLSSNLEDVINQAVLRVKT